MEIRFNECIKLFKDSDEENCSEKATVKATKTTAAMKKNEKPKRYIQQFN